MGFTVVQWASIMYDLDPRVIGLLKEAGADITRRFKFSSPIGQLHRRRPNPRRRAGALQLKATSAQPSEGGSKAGATKMIAMFGGMEGGTVLHEHRLDRLAQGTTPPPATPR